MTESKIYLFNFISFESIDTIDTGKNENGMISISTDPDKTIVAYLAEKQGHVQIKVYNEDSEPEIKDIRAHSSNVACISLNKKGNLFLYERTKDRNYNTICMTKKGLLYVTDLIVDNMGYYYK